jgi:DUF1365 family protein
LTTLVPVTGEAVLTRGSELRSAIYEGTLRHRRFGPGITNEFSYKVAMPLLDLAEIDSVTRLHPLWSSKRPAPVWFRRSDFLGNPAVPLDQAVRDLVEERSGTRPAGAIGLLANVRTWGWLFNPISLYFCGDADDIGVESLVAEVENTPWHERCSYVVGPPGEHRFAKTMHVSPFLPMDVDYELRYTAPTGRLIVHFDVLRGGERLFAATLSLCRQGLDRRSLGRLLWATPAVTHRVSAGIYAQASRLHLRGAPLYRHPAKRAECPSPREKARRAAEMLEICPREMNERS